MLITIEPIFIIVVWKSMNFVNNIKMSELMKRMVVIICFFLISLNILAPASRAMFIEASEGMNPFGKIINAIGMVETKHDTLAYNPAEGATGYFQIRPIRLKDYNVRTGSKYAMKDMYNYYIAEKIFLYYASQIGPYNNEKIARNWNGSGYKTRQYWRKVQKYL